MCGSFILKPNGGLNLICSWGFFSTAVVAEQSVCLVKLVIQQCSIAFRLAQLGPGSTRLLMINRIDSDYS